MLRLSWVVFFVVKTFCWAFTVCFIRPGRVAQSVGHLTRKSGVLGRYPVWQHTFVSPSAFSRRAVVSYWRKYVHEVLVNRLGLSLPRKSVVRLTDRPDMTLDVYRGRKTTIQQQLFHQQNFRLTTVGTYLFPLAFIFVMPKYLTCVKSQ